MVLWIYLGAYICFVRKFSRFWIYQGYTRFLIYVSMLLINAWICLGICQKQKLNLLYNLRSIYRYLGVFKILSNIQNGLGAFTKNSYCLELFPKDNTICFLQYVIYRNVITVGLLNIPRSWICHRFWICLGSEYARVHNIMKKVKCGSKLH